MAIRYFKVPFSAEAAETEGYGAGTWYAEFADGIVRRQFEVYAEHVLVAPYDIDFTDQDDESIDESIEDTLEKETTLAEFEVAWQRYSAPRLAQIASAGSRKTE